MSIKIIIPHVTRRSLMKELRAANLTWEAAKRTAKDRRKWRMTVAE
jgi:hypothetical protein